MSGVISVDVAKQSFDIFRDLTVQARERSGGPPVRMDGMTVGILTLTDDAPHDGEMHPDGDEILYVISGRLKVELESAPDAPIFLEAGGACIVERGVWHKVSVLEETNLLHITPGPGGDHRPLGWRAKNMPGGS